MDYLNLAKQNARHHHGKFITEEVEIAGINYNLRIYYEYHDVVRRREDDPEDPRVEILSVLLEVFDDFVELAFEIDESWLDRINDKEQ